MKHKKELRSSTWDNIIIFFVALLALAVAIIGHRQGMQQKWDAAIVGTAAPFGVVIMSYRRWWFRLSFWFDFATLSWPTSRI